jgi:hypothetical protein
LPKRFDAGSGLIIDPNDNMSKQIDAIIYDALNCPVYRASERGRDYTKRQAFENARSVKGLAKEGSFRCPR